MSLLSSFSHRLPHLPAALGLPLPFSPRLPAPPEPVFTLYDYPGSRPQTQAIPATIWSYWTGGTPPLLVQRCIAGWKRLHPEHDIRVLSDAELSRYIPLLPAAVEQLIPAKRADWIRLELLRRHGGIWLDASIVLTRPLNWVHALQEAQQSDFVGFYLEGFTSLPRYPVVENWFLAAPAHSPLIEEWQEEFTRHAIVDSGAAYVRHLEQQGHFDRIRQKILYLDYLSMHLAFQQILQTQGHYRLTLQRVEDGPYFYHVLAHWKRRRLHRLLFRGNCSAGVPSLVKLRGADRRHFDEDLEAHRHAPHSFVARYLT